MAVCNHRGSLPEARVTHKRGEWSDVVEKKLKDGEIFFDISSKKGIWTGVQDLESGKVLAHQVAVSPGELNDAIEKINTGSSEKFTELEAKITEINTNIETTTNELRASISSLEKKANDITGEIGEIYNDIGYLNAVTIEYGSNVDLAIDMISKFINRDHKTVIYIKYKNEMLPAEIGSDGKSIKARVLDDSGVREVSLKDGKWSDETWNLTANIVVNSMTVGGVEMSSKTGDNLVLGTNGKKILISNLQNPVNNSDAATKEYVDSKISADVPVVRIPEKGPDDFTQEDMKNYNPDKLYILNDGNLYMVEESGVDNQHREFKFIHTGSDSGPWNEILSI